MIPNNNGPFVRYSNEINPIFSKKFTNSGNFDLRILDIFFDYVKVNNDSNESLKFDFVRRPNLKSEEYVINIVNGIIAIMASDEKGITNGLKSIFQLTKNEGLSNMMLGDLPKFWHREFMVDMARNFISIEELKKIIDQAALLKLNYLHLHLSDDQGWRIESKLYPKLHEIAGKDGYYTQEQLKELVEYSLIRGVEIIPEIDMPGHTSAMLAAYPELGCEKKEIELNPAAGIRREILCVGNKDTREFARNIIGEISSIFPCKYFHIGGDEVNPYNWLKCEECKEMMRKNNTTSPKDLEALFLNEMAGYLSSLGKTTICWNDARKSKLLRDDIVIQNWCNYMGDKSTLNAFQNGKIELISGSTVTTYFDYPYCLTPLSATYNTAPNIHGKELNGINGTSAHIWTETITDSDLLEYMIFPRLMAFAENSWSKELNYKDFTDRLRKYLETFGKNLNYAPLDEATIKGVNARIKTAQYFLTRTGAIPQDLTFASVMNALSITFKLMQNNFSITEMGDIARRTVFSKPKTK